MPFLVGTDEAGYSPNLGPLVISTTVWHVAEAMDLDMYARLRAVVSKTPPRNPLRRVAIADSKALYSRAAGLSVLERGVLAALALVNQCPADWLEAWQMLDPGAIAHLDSLPWHAGCDLRLPLAADPDDIVRVVPTVRRGFERAGVRLVAILSRAVFPEQFNRTTQELGNKSETLSRITLQLVAEALAHCQGEPTLVVCDKHGGRNFYGRLLQQQFPDWLVEVHGESSAESIYRWQSDGQRVEVRFRVRGERFLPAALASMTSKYLRELSMRAFNDFWCTRVDDLAPTAGYPQDARRFRAAIRPLQESLGIDDQLLWRERQVMLLYIVRHAFAGQHGDPHFPDDSLRPLTKKGRKRFDKLVKKLSRGSFAPSLIASSPLVRCRQTADAIVERVVPLPKLVEMPQLEPGGAWQELIDWSNSQKANELAWVGHAPDVDDMAASLLGSREGSFKFAKGAIAAIRFEDQIVSGRGVLQWLVSPRLNGK